MRRSLIVAGAAALVFAAGPEASACGDKFLVSGRGTRYQRPKTARAASVVLYANPPLAAAQGKPSLEAVLKREGHRLVTVGTAEQLAALLAGGRFDVVVVAASVVGAVKELLAGAADAPAVVAVAEPVKEGTLLKAVDKAVAHRDRTARRSPLKG